MTADCEQAAMRQQAALVPAPATLSAHVDGRVTLWSIDTGKVSRLNEAGTRIWHGVSASEDLADIAIALSCLTGMSLDDSHLQVRQFVEQLATGGWLQSNVQARIEHRPKGRKFYWPVWRSAIAERCAIAVRSIAQRVPEVQLQGPSRSMSDPYTCLVAGIYEGVVLDSAQSHRHSRVRWLSAIAAAAEFAALFDMCGYQGCTERLSLLGGASADGSGGVELIATLRMEVTTIRMALRLVGLTSACFGESFALAAALKTLGHDVSIVVGHAECDMGVLSPLHAWIAVANEPLSEQRDITTMYRPLMKITSAGLLTPL